MRGTVLALLLLSGCATPAPRAVPPDAQAAYEQGVLAQRGQRQIDARGFYERAIALAPHHADAHVALARLLREEDKADAATAHANGLAADQPAMADLLRGVLAPDDADRRPLLERALEQDPTLLAAALELGKLLRRQHEYAAALEALERVLDVRPQHTEALVHSAYCHFHAFDWPRAVAAASRALETDERSLEARLIVAVNRLIKRDYDGAIAHYRTLRDQHPDHAFSIEERFVFLLAYRARLARLRQARDVEKGAPLAAEASRVFPSSSLMRDHHGYFTELSGDVDAALALYREALALDPYATPVVRDIRRVLFARGDRAEALAIWKRIVPLAVLLRPDNAVGARWRALLAAVEASPAGPLTEDAARTLSAALAGVGWLDEAASACRGHPGLELERRRHEQLSAFVHRLRQRVHDHYANLERGRGGTSLDAIGHWIASEWPNACGAAPDLGLDLARYYLLVREATPFTAGPGSVAAALSRYGLFFDIGDNEGHVDLRLNRLLYRARYEQRVGRLPYRYSPAVIDETLIDNYLGYLTGSPRIAGRAFLSRQGFYVALDTIRPAEWQVRRFLRAPEQPSEPRGDRTARVRYDARLDARLRQRFLARFGLPHPDPEPDAARVDAAFDALLLGGMTNVWMHELGHVVDFEKYVPLMPNLAPNIGVSLRCGLSPKRIVGRFEHIAETFSLATTRYPFLCLQDNLDRLQLDPDSLYYMVLVAWQKRDPRDSPYYLGAGRILGDLLDALGGRLSDLGDADAARIQDVARRVCRDEGFPFEEE